MKCAYDRAARDADLFECCLQNTMLACTCPCFILLQHLRNCPPLTPRNTRDQLCDRKQCFPLRKSLQTMSRKECANERAIM